MVMSMSCLNLREMCFPSNFMLFVVLSAAPRHVMDRKKVTKMVNSDLHTAVAHSVFSCWKTRKVVAPVGAPLSAVGT